MPILPAAAFLYLLAALGRAVKGKQSPLRWQRWLSTAEKLAYIVLTAGLVVYIQSLDVAGTLLQESRWPVSWLLLAWSIATAHLVSELAYGNRFTSVFANTWVAVAILMPSLHRSPSLARMFTHDLEWLNFHRLCFMIAYAFCLLALPLALEYLWRSWHAARRAGRGSGEEDASLPQLDRLQFRLILWSLPLLTVGFLVEALLLALGLQFLLLPG
ncbi:MAG: cytochrome c biogenesis protein CcsA [Bdellovibrionales bacterium]|nr:cytochrome c biogenesis protein CcsA [Bdellovibrionales bacterium]